MVKHLRLAVYGSIVLGCTIGNADGDLRANAAEQASKAQQGMDQALQKMAENKQTLEEIEKQRKENDCDGKDRNVVKCQELEDLQTKTEIDQLKQAQIASDFSKQQKQYAALAQSRTDSEPKIPTGGTHQNGSGSGKKEGTPMLPPPQSPQQQQQGQQDQQKKDDSTSKKADDSTQSKNPPTQIADTSAASKAGNNTQQTDAQTNALDQLLAKTVKDSQSSSGSQNASASDASAADPKVPPDQLVSTAQMQQMQKALNDQQLAALKAAQTPQAPAAAKPTRAQILQSGGANIASEGLGGGSLSGKPISRSLGI